MQGSGRGRSGRRSLYLGEWVFPASSRAFEEMPEAPAGRTSSASNPESRLDSAIRDCGAHAASPGETQGQTSEVRRGSREVCALGPRAPGGWTGRREGLEGWDLPGEGRHPPGVSTWKESPFGW